MTGLLVVKILLIAGFLVFDAVLLVDRRKQR